MLIALLSLSLYSLTTCGTRQTKQHIASTKDKVKITISIGVIPNSPIP